MRTLLLLLIFTTALFSQEVLDISVKGISNDKKDGAQQDRLEALLDAKRQACEKAGLKLESKTTVENFEVVYDYVESKAETVLLPGFQVIDIGYVQDGTYQVVLTGKIQVVEAEEQISIKELRYAQSLRDRGKHSQCEAILKKYIDDKEENVSAELKEEAFYHFIKWGYSWNVEEDYYKFESFYPESKHLSNLKKFAEFSAKPLYVHSGSYKSLAEDWVKKERTYKEHTFNKQIEVATDTIIFKDFRQNEKSLIMQYTLFSEDKSDKPTTAYELVILFYDGNVKTVNPLPKDSEQFVKVMNRFKVFRAGGSPTFQHSSSGESFKHFRLKFFELKGDTPVGEGSFTQTLKFKILQKSY